MAFYDGRPERETWELIGGVPYMMSPPRVVHQRISDNLYRLLGDRIHSLGLGWVPSREIGVRIPEDDTFAPEPDVTVIDIDVAEDLIWAERFYFVAEVLSGKDRPEKRDGSDKPRPLAAKLDYYKAHSHCRGVIIVRQDIVAAELHVRREGGWTEASLAAPGDRIAVPDIGDIGPLAHLYRYTPLWRAEFAAL
ncbi:MAG: Uma2 family endonuclease [Hyphomicrobiaceae bacterium]|nr:Uma2 family endonuclease [Hyphomicrobiaceae bacterium]